jgi:hypothetical protein
LKRDIFAAARGGEIVNPPLEVTHPSKKKKSHISIGYKSKYVQSPFSKNYWSNFHKTSFHFSVRILLFSVSQSRKFIFGFTNRVAQSYFSELTDMSDKVGEMRKKKNAQKLNISMEKMVNYKSSLYYSTSQGKFHFECYVIRKSSRFSGIRHGRGYINNAEKSIPVCKCCVYVCQTQTIAELSIIANYVQWNTLPRSRKIYYRFSHLTLPSLGSLSSICKSFDCRIVV